MPQYIKRLLSLLPTRWLQGLKRIHYSYQINRGRFNADEPEEKILDQCISKGDWVIDIGANVGHYTYKFSNLVGENGRVIVFEPVPDTFEILASNVQYFRFKNVTLLNIAVSDRPSISHVEIPIFNTGLKNYYMASLSNKSTGLNVFCIPIDSIPFCHNIRLVKIDAEGHELSVLVGMKKLLQRVKPMLIIETDTQDVFEFMERLGYTKEKYPDSPNYVFR